MSRKAIVTIVIAAIIAVISITGVIYGVISMDDSPPPQLKVCWIDIGNNIYQADYDISRCDDPVSIIWPSNQIPIGINVDNPEGVGEVRAAIRDFNSRFRMSLLEFRGDDALVKWNAAFHSDDPPADCSHQKVAGRFKGIISVRDTSSFETTRVILLHEFGHLIGLDHSTQNNNIMKAQIINDLPGLKLGFSDRQIKWAREEY